MAEDEVILETAGVALQASLDVPQEAEGVVLFAHGSGSSRHSPRNRFVAAQLRGIGLATCQMDLLTAEEEEVDLRTAHLRFDIGLLARRLVGAIDWLGRHASTEGLSLGCFGASTGAAGALAAAAERPDAVRTVVSRGGRPDLAGGSLQAVRAPTLLVVGALDRQVLELNRDALQRLPPESRLEVVPRAGHLFEEPGALEQVARLAAGWFGPRLGPRRTSGSAR